MNQQVRKGSPTSIMGLGAPITPAEREIIRRAVRTIWPEITLGEWIRQTLLAEAERLIAKTPWLQPQAAAKEVGR